MVKRVNALPQGTIVLVNVMFTNYSGQKIRPAIVMSKTIADSVEDYIIVPLTSKLRKNPYSVEINSCNTIGKFMRTSEARPDKLTTLHKSQVRTEIGHVTKEITSKIRSAIVSLI